MKTPKEIFDSKYEIYRNMNGKPSIPLEARPLIFAVAELYHSQFKLFAVTDEEIKQSFCDQLEGILRGVKLKNFCTGEDDALPLIDHLCQTGSKDISSGREEIENIVEQVYFEFNIDALKSQLKPAEKEEKKLIVIDETILQKAIDTWGMEAQIEMVKEECLELAIALQKLNRTRGDLEEKEKNIVDEIADVTIMIKQAHRIFSIDKINERIEYKMKRLEKRLIEKVG